MFVGLQGNPNAVTVIVFPLISVFCGRHPPFPVSLFALMTNTEYELRLIEFDTTCGGYAAWALKKPPFRCSIYDALRVTLRNSGKYTPQFWSWAWDTKTEVK